MALIVVIVVFVFVGGFAVGELRMKCFGSLIQHQSFLTLYIRILGTSAAYTFEGQSGTL